MSNTEIEFDNSETLEIEFEDENDSTDGIEEILPVIVTAECAKMQQNQHQILKIQISSSGYKKDILNRYSNHKSQAKEQEQEQKDSSDDEDDNKLAIYSDIENNIENDKNEVTEVTEVTEISDDEIIVIDYDDDNISDNLIVIKEETNTYEIGLESINKAKTIESIDEINEKNTSRLNEIKTSDIYVTYLKNKNYLKYVLTDKSYFSMNKKTVIEYKEKIKNSKSDFETAVYKRNILSYEKLINDEEEKYDKIYMWNKANESNFKNLQKQIYDIERLLKFGIDKLNELQKIEDKRISQEKKKEQMQQKKKLAEQQKLEEEKKKLTEQQKLEEEKKKLIEQQKLEEEKKKLAEQQKLEEEKQQQKQQLQNIIASNNKFINMLDFRINYFTLNSKPNPITSENGIDTRMKWMHIFSSYYEAQSSIMFMSNNDLMWYNIGLLSTKSNLFSNILRIIYKLFTYNHKNNMLHNAIWNDHFIIYILFITSELIFNNYININIPSFIVIYNFLKQNIQNIITKTRSDINEIFINQDLQIEFRLTIIETLKFCKILLLNFLVSKNIEINIPLKVFPFPPYISKYITKVLSNTNIPEKRKAEEMSSSTEESSSSEPKKVCISIHK